MANRKKVIRGLEVCSSSWMFCQKKECPYSDNPLTCKYVLMRDALTLMKEQEARVMTLVEIQSGTVEVAWLEYSDREEVQGGLWFKRINEGEDEGIIIHVLDGFEGLRTAVYGKTWRCWTARPTEVQRKAVKWDG